MRQLMTITKALADEHRVRTLLALRAGELCVCQITALFQLAPSTVSKHLSILHHASLVESRKEGRWIYYALPQNGGAPAIRQVIQWLEKSLAGDSRIRQDRQELKRILRIDPVQLCKRQCRN